MALHLLLAALLVASDTAPPAAPDTACGFPGAASAVAADPASARVAEATSAAAPASTGFRDPAFAAGPGPVSAVYPPAPAAAGPDFLFGHPRGSLAVRLGRTFARAQSDLFQETMEVFTLGEGDFDAWTMIGDGTVWLADRADLLVSFTYSRSAAGSEYHALVGDDDLPIEQETSLSQIAATVGARVYPLGRGRGIGRLAWIPRRVTPYVGAAGGVLRYSFMQVGEFVRSDMAIVEDELTAGGWGPVGHLSAGMEVGVSTRALLVLEGRYTAAAGRIGGDDDYRGYDDLDLSGYQATAGLAIRF